VGRELPVADKNELILQIALGNDAHLHVELLRRFDGQKPQTSEADEPRRTVTELLDSATARRDGRERLATERRQYEQAVVNERERSPASSTLSRWRCARNRLGSVWTRWSTQEGRGSTTRLSSCSRTCRPSARGRTDLKRSNKAASDCVGNT
jgi:hypothetical protein